MSLPPARCYVGLDWAAETHAVCVLDAAGTVLTSFTIAHSADGIASLISRLAKYGEPIDIPVGIERPDGRLVDLLLEAGHPVVPVSPNAIKSWREGEVISGAKSDPGDTQVIAEYLRLRQHRLSPLHVRVGGQNHFGVGLAAPEERPLQIDDAGVDAVDGVANPQPDVGSNLVVAAAGRV